MNRTGNGKLEHRPKKIIHKLEEIYFYNSIFLNLYSNNICFKVKNTYHNNNMISRGKSEFEYICHKSPFPPQKGHFFFL